MLDSWKDTPTREAIVEFVQRATRTDSDAFVPVDERVAVFDNDGTLWCEKPMPIELASSSPGSRRCPTTTPRCANASPGRPRTSVTTHGSGAR
jgi:hypothetical protein